MKFNTNLLFFPQASMLAMSESSVFVGKRGNHPENCGQQEKNKKEKKRSGLNFRIVSIRRYSFLEKTEKRLLVYRINSAEKNIQTDVSSLSARAAGLFQPSFSSELSHKPQQCRFCSGPLVLWDQSEIILGKIKAKKKKKLKKTGCVEVKKKAEISHRM